MPITLVAEAASHNVTIAGNRKSTSAAMRRIAAEADGRT
jgi:hypothetical protein